MEKFILGCNYWASDTGTEMWKNFNISVIENNIKTLSENHVEYLRVFPNWRDFQPIIPIMEGTGIIVEYKLENDVTPKNPYYLDEKMLSEFSEFCDICSKYNIKLIVGLLTGWMSGRLFIPSALYGKNLMTDSVALLFEQRFIMGFIKKFKNETSIVAWDLGNECNCMATVNNRFEAQNWTATISNAIRSADNSRPVISGMHSLSANDSGPLWSIQCQAEFTDILTTHPYPYWVDHTRLDKIASFRTSVHATCETKLYSDIGQKPCLVEEIGTMGPMLCSNERAADFLRCNMFSNWANGSLGVMWWCANEQTNLKTIPYTKNMCEVELGMLDINGNPKPVLNEMKHFSEFLSSLDFKLPKAKTDALCILTQAQDQWGVAYMTYCLAKQANLNIEFSYCNQKLPERSLYIIPSIKGPNVMPAETFAELKKRVYNGAELYISNDDGILREFEDLTGIKVTDASLTLQNSYVELNEEKIPFSRTRFFETESVNATVLAKDSYNTPAISKNQYGKGTVYYVNFPLEAMLINKSNSFDSNTYLIYKELFKETTNKHEVITESSKINLTIHNGESETYCVAINHSHTEENPNFIFNKCKVKKVFYGNIDSIMPFDAVVFSICKH